MKSECTKNCRFYSYIGHSKCKLIKCVGFSPKSVDVTCQRCGETYTVEPYTPGQNYICICGNEDTI